MKVKHIYMAEWFIEQGNINTKNYLRFALDTSNPEDAIRIILSSEIAHQQKGSLANFSGPQGTIYTD